MATMIPTITISEFKALKVAQIKQMKSCEVYADGEFLCTIINGNLEDSGYIKTRAEYLALSSNTLGGKPIEEILDAVPV